MGGVAERDGHRAADQDGATGCGGDRGRPVCRAIAGERRGPRPRVRTQSSLKHEAGTATEQVLIEAGKTASLFVPLAARPQPPVAAAGWIAVPAPWTCNSSRTAVSSAAAESIESCCRPGRHELKIVNEALGFQERHVVQRHAGPGASIKLNLADRKPRRSTPCRGRRRFVDGAPVGETPIANVAGPHRTTRDLFRHPQLGEHRASVTVTTREPAKVGIDLRAK